MTNSFKIRLISVISWQKLPVIGLFVATAFPFFTHAVNAQETLEQRTIVRMDAWSVVRKQDPFTDFVTVEAQNFSEDGVLLRISCAISDRNLLEYSMDAESMESAGFDIGDIFDFWDLSFHWPNSNIDFDLMGEHPGRSTALLRVEGSNLMHARIYPNNDWEHDDIPGPLISIEGYDRIPVEFTHSSTGYYTSGYVFHSLLIEKMIENDGARFLARFFINGPSGQLDVAFDTTGIAQAIEPLLEHCEY